MNILLAHHEALLSLALNVWVWLGAFILSVACLIKGHLNNWK